MAWSATKSPQVRRRRYQRIRRAGPFIMGLLRASADAVMVGSGTLHQTAPEHLFVAGCVFPGARDLYSRYRSEALKKTAPPLQVVVSGTGRVDLTRAIFRTPGIQTLIVTTQAGRDLLAVSGVGSLVSTEVRSFEGPIIAPAEVLELLRAEFGVSLLLHEGGPTLFGRSWRTAASTNFSSP